MLYIYVIVNLFHNYLLVLLLHDFKEQEIVFRFPTPSL